MFIYVKQIAWVVWGPSRRCSSSFRLTNGTRQGSVISPTIWCTYWQDLLDRLHALGVGCHLPGGTFGPSPSHPVGGILCSDTFFGVTIYADDILLLAPTLSSLQLMAMEVEMFASSHNILFSTNPNPSRSKSKCVWFCGKSGEVSYPAPIMLNGDALPGWSLPPIWATSCTSSTPWSTTPGARGPATSRRPPA